MKIREDKTKGVVFIDGMPLAGFIDDGACPKCKCDRIYTHDYDTYLCVHCNEWLKAPCDDPDCKYCRRRSPSPDELFKS